MKYQVESTKSINRRVGDRVFNNQTGEKLELSGAGVEVALSEMMDGAYKLVREIPETPEEKEIVKAAEEKAAMMAEPKKELVRQAEKLHIGGAGELLKEPLADAILDTKSGAADRMDAPGISHITETKTAKSTARSKGDKQ
ncbi:MAG TPA: hypothetical protein VNI84_08680 [Pyrinomonadaceae bacterium]|nr:hypothetical protein [Pyrinomonadaceae bacterium]